MDVEFVEGHNMAQEIPSASIVESLYFNEFQILPDLAEGVFSRRPQWVAMTTRLDTDGKVVRFCHKLQRKYQSDRLYVRVFTKKALLVFDPEGIRHVLDHSPDVYGPADLKKKGMGHFQPSAVTISEGVEWEERRRFNEAVLNSGAPSHCYAHQFLHIVRSEIEATRAASGDVLAWNAIADLFDKITLQVTFGMQARQETELTERLARMMLESNPPVPRKKSEDFDPFYERIREHLKAPEADSLMALAAQTGATERTRVENQVPHWMFAMRDTLAANTARALAVITARPDIEVRVREEMLGNDLATPDGITRLRYLQGCVHEAMRLWPTTPLLVRVALRDDDLAGTPVVKGTQILILNTYNHRNQNATKFADAFEPEQWRDQQPNYLFNHLSNGTQVCAGLDLALFIAQAVIVGLLEHNRYALEHPKLHLHPPLPYMLNYFELRWRRMLLSL
jgi:cytochrome P450